MGFFSLNKILVGISILRKGGKGLEREGNFSEVVIVHSSFHGKHALNPLYSGTLPSSRERKVSKTGFWPSVCSLSNGRERDGEGGNHTSPMC